MTATSAKSGRCSTTLRADIPANYLFGVFRPLLPCGVGACSSCMVKLQRQQIRRSDVQRWPRHRSDKEFRWTKIKKGRRATFGCLGLPLRKHLYIRGSTMPVRITRHSKKQPGHRIASHERGGDARLTAMSTAICLTSNTLGAFVTNPLTYTHWNPATGTRVVPLDAGVLVHTGLPNPGLKKVIEPASRRLGTPVNPGDRACGRQQRR
jgi:hypothetical protein